MGGEGEIKVPILNPPYAPSSSVLLSDNVELEEEEEVGTGGGGDSGDSQIVIYSLERYPAAKYIL